MVTHHWFSFVLWFIMAKRRFIYIGRCLFVLWNFRSSCIVNTTFSFISVSWVSFVKASEYQRGCSKLQELMCWIWWQSCRFSIMILLSVIRASSYLHLQQQQACYRGAYHWSQFLFSLSLFLQVSDNQSSYSAYSKHSLSINNH